MAGFAAVEPESRASLAQLLDERGKIGEAAHFSVPLRRSRKIEVSKGVRFAAARLDSVAPEKGSTDQMRRKVAALPDAEIEARLAEAQRQKLRVAVGEMQQRYVAERRQIVEGFVLRTRS